MPAPRAILYRPAYVFGEPLADAAEQTINSDDGSLRGLAQLSQDAAITLDTLLNQGFASIRILRTDDSGFIVSVFDGDDSEPLFSGTQVGWFEFIWVREIEGWAFIGSGGFSAADVIVPPPDTANEVLLTPNGVTAQWGQIVNAQVAASAAIAGTKVSPDFGAQAIVTTGALSIGAGPHALGVTGAEEVELRFATLDAPYGIATEHIVDANGFRDDVLSFGYNVKGQFVAIVPTDLRWGFQFERGFAQGVGEDTHCEFWFGYMPPSSSEQFRLWGCTFNQNTEEGEFAISGGFAISTGGPNSTPGDLVFKMVWDGSFVGWYRPLSFTFPAGFESDGGGIIYVQNVTGDNYIPAVGRVDGANKIGIASGGHTTRIYGDLEITDDINLRTATCAVFSAQTSNGGSSAARALEAKNPTAATSGSQQQASTALDLVGSGWDSGAAAARTATWRMYNPVIPGNPVRGRLFMQEDIGGGGFATRFDFVGGSSPSIGVAGASWFSYSAGTHIYGATNMAGDMRFFVGSGRYIELNVNSVQRLKVDSTGIGFFTAAPVAQSTGWLVTNPVTRKTFDTTTVTLPQIAEVVGTLVDYLKTRGDLGA